jgi:hypothetical protein
MDGALLARAYMAESAGMGYLGGMIVPGQSSEGLTGHKIRKFSFLYVWKESP